MVRRRVRVQTRHHLQKGVLLCGRLKFETVSSWGLNWQLKFAGIGLRSNCRVRMSWRLVSSKALERLMNWCRFDESYDYELRYGVMLGCCSGQKWPLRREQGGLLHLGVEVMDGTVVTGSKHSRFLKECFCCMPVLEHVMPMLEYIVL